MPREIVTLQCGDCKNRNYSTTKNKKTTTARLEFKKFCRTCRKHTAHKEVKIAVSYQPPALSLLLAVRLIGLRAWPA